MPLKNSPGSRQVTGAGKRQGLNPLKIGPAMMATWTSKRQGRTNNRVIFPTGNRLDNMPFAG